MKRSKEQVMPAIAKELRERINARRTAKLRAFPGIPLDEPGLLDDVISALEAAAPVADAVEACEDTYVLRDPREADSCRWSVENGGVFEFGATLPAAVAALRNRTEGDSK